MLIGFKIHNSKQNPFPIKPLPNKPIPNKSKRNKIVSRSRNPCRTALKSIFSPLFNFSQIPKTQENQYFLLFPFPLYRTNLKIHNPNSKIIPSLQRNIATSTIFTSFQAHSHTILPNTILLQPEKPSHIWDSHNNSPM